MTRLTPKDYILAPLIGYVLKIQPFWDKDIGELMIWLTLTVLSLSILDLINQCQAKRKSARERQLRRRKRKNFTLKL